MTENEWLATAEPEDLFWFVRDRLSDRKLRLFGCAGVRQLWDALPKDALREATEICERFADGLATKEELSRAWDMADAAYEGIGDIIADHSALGITDLCRTNPSYPMGTGSSPGVPAALAESLYSEELSWGEADSLAKVIHCRLFRDVFGNPFREVEIDPGWKTNTVVSLAKAAYDKRSLPLGTLDITVFAILADALEEAGCDNVDVLTHCREPGEHVRGCWVLDLILGNE